MGFYTRTLKVRIDALMKKGLRQDRSQFNPPLFGVRINR